MAEFIFFFSFFIIFYTYIGYGALIFVLIRIRNFFTAPRKLAVPGSFHPPVTLIVAAFNEESFIQQKIENSLALDYPPGWLKLIFISDGSDDLTASIIRRYHQIISLHEDERRGKVAAINRAMIHVETPYVIFSDANTVLNKESVREIMKHYADPRVGGVAGEKKIAAGIKGGASESGEGIYWKYESLLKSLDSEFHTVVGAAGELFSVKTTVYNVLREDTIIDDFVQSMKICLAGLIIRYEPRAYATETASLTMKEEQKRKIRISAGGFQAMAWLGSVFNIRKYPVLLFQYLSHRVFRWTLCPICLITLYLSDMVLVKTEHSNFYDVFFGLQTVFYAAAFTGWLFALRNMKFSVLYIPYYFVFMNLSVATGFYRFIRGTQSAVWEKAMRQSL